jgi:hypothetical protein
VFRRVNTMVGDQLKTSTAASALGDVLGGLTDLVQKEMRLAQAELSANLSAKLEGGVWWAAAGALAGIAFLLVVQAAVFVIASYGVPMHWSCLIAAGLLNWAPRCHRRSDAPPDYPSNPTGRDPE